MFILCTRNKGKLICEWADAIIIEIDKDVIDKQIFLIQIQLKQILKNIDLIEFDDDICDSNTDTNSLI